MITVRASDAGGWAVSLPPPARLVCEKAYDIPAEGLELVLPAGGELAARELAEITVELDGKELFSGLVDEQLTKADGEGIMMTVRARSRAALLLDNEAVPNAYARPALVDIYNMHVRQYGFGGIVYDKNAVLPGYAVAKGKSEWQVLEGFCRQALGLRPRVENGCIVVRRRGAGNALLLGNGGRGTPYSALSVRVRRYGILSRIILKSATGLYDTPVENPAAQRAGIKRKRYVSPPKEWSVSPGAGADRLLRDSMAKRLTVTAVIPELIAVQMGDRATLADGPADLGTLAVAGITYRADGNGRSTELTLLAPEYLD